MKTVIATLALVLSFASAAQATTNLGFMLAGSRITPDLVTIVTAALPGDNYQERYLEAQFYVSECEAKGLKNEPVFIHVGENAYLMVETKGGVDCGIEYMPKKSWYKIKFDWAPEAIRDVVINGKRLPVR